MTCLAWIRLVGVWLLAASAVPATSQQPRGAGQEPGQLKVIQVKEPDGQILSYGDLSRPTEVSLGGTNLAREAHLKLKIQGASSGGLFFRKRRPGFVDIDINRGNISGLQPPQQFGKDFLTYVLWAVSGDGKASNLGEIPLGGQKPISINARTPYQAFWLMVTAEPDFAVVDPSPKVVLYSVDENARKERTEKTEKKAPAPPKKANLFFYTHYSEYDSAPTAVEAEPNDLLQARKAVELATRSGIPGAESASGAGETGAGSHTTRGILARAKSFLGQAETAYKKHPKGNNVVQPARTAAQVAENARALALGAAGNSLIRQLEEELARVRAELEDTRAELSRANARSSSGDPSTSSPEASEPQATTALPLGKPTVATQLAKIVSKPSVWFGLIGWGVAILLLLRRQPS